MRVAQCKQPEAQVFKDIKSLMLGIASKLDTLIERQEQGTLPVLGTLLHGRVQKRLDEGKSPPRLVTVCAEEQMPDFTALAHTHDVKPHSTRH